MPVITARTRGKQLVKYRTRLGAANTETLHASARFLGESIEYVLTQVTDTVLARDKEFLRWRVTHPEPCLPATSGGRRPARATVARLAGRPETAPQAVHA